ncbi:SRPBCC family protein [Propylenella binzhouense]|uniref:SRPBCC family protein n=1 Tax=Propylenella binzhouense TaxID=2555902 RepID=A0A964WTW3_9HYPH|nr:SRPBCC family protein [Propylenella binzhouense]MYZ48230.1 SRPBCC family protein [Propylenella binzhouense]
MARSTDMAESDAPVSTLKSGSRPKDAGLGTEHARVTGRTVTINRPRETLYAFWRDFANLPRFMENVADVAVLDPARSHWKVAAPGGGSVEWDAVIVADEPGRLIAWESAEGADIRHSGRIEFRDAPPGRGSEVSATIAYDPPGGALGALVAKLFQREPHIQARRDLRRFKQLMETGEISTAEPPEAAPRAA